MAELARAFICIEIPAVQQAKLAEIKDELGNASLVRWTQAHLMHITIRFLGDLTSAQVEQVTAVVNEAVAGGNDPVESFTVSLDQLGCFPNSNRPRVVWAGQRTHNPQLDTLHGRVERLLTERGFRADDHGHFSPHVTLGRARPKASSDEVAALGRRVRVAQSHWLTHGRELAQFTATGLTVMNSRLTPAGPIYTPVATASFRGAVQRVSPADQPDR